MIIDHSDLDWAQALLEGLDRARSLTVWLLVKYSEWGQLVNLTCNPSEYCDFDQLNFRSDYQATELFRKIVDAPTGIDTKQAAIDSFYDAEEQCSRTNRRLYPVMLSMQSVHHYGVPVWLQEFITSWRFEIKMILGPIPNELNFKFSSGSTFDDRRFILPMDKMSSRPTVTANATSIVDPFWRRTLWHDSLCSELPYRSNPRVIRGNRFTTVPKSAKTDRGICVEPSLNVTTQLSVGSTIRKRLRVHDIDLRYGQSLHQSLVRTASLTKALATIDLSSASDTVAYNLVKLVLPPMWFDLLDSLRSPETCIYGKWHKNAKFSSMGNGFTFELETLIFYTLCTTIAIQTKSDKTQIKTYGDDIIVPQNMAAKVLEALTYFGFTPNQRKTYVGDVPFRESCGADYFNGVPVRGHYVETIPKTPLEWISLANGIRRMAEYDLDVHGDLCSYWPAWLRVLQHIPKSYRNFGPVHLSDSVIHTDDKTWWRTRVCNGKHELRVTATVFSDSSYSYVDRRCWSRGSIIAAAVLGHLRGAGLQHRESKRRGWFAMNRPFLKPRAEITGWKVVWQSYTLNNNLPTWICQPYFGLTRKGEPM